MLNPDMSSIVFVICPPPTDCQCLSFPVSPAVVVFLFVSLSKDFIIQIKLITLIYLLAIVAFSKWVTVQNTKLSYECGSDTKIVKIL